MDAVHAQFAQLRTKLDDISSLQKLEDQIHIPKEYIAVAGSFLFALLVLFGIGAGSLSSIIGFIYPAFKSFQAIESHASSEVTQWLIYWVVYSFFSIIEVFVNYLLYWIPFYYAFKMAFLLWAMLPQTRGAKFLYDNFLKDFLKANESKIDAALKDAKISTGKLAEGVKDTTATVTDSANKKDK